MVLICPYCDIEISEKLVEAEDGCCPECGTLITARSVADQLDGEDDDYGNDIYEEDEYADEFNDDFDLDDEYEEYTFGDPDENADDDLSFEPETQDDEDEAEEDEPPVKKSSAKRSKSKSK